MCFVHRGVGDLIMVYKRVSNLASHTSRVSELLEQVMSLIFVSFFLITFLSHSLLARLSGRALRSACEARSA